MDERSNAPVTLETAVREYLSLLAAEARKEQQQQLSRFVRWMGGDQPLGALVAHDVAAFAESVLRAGANDPPRLLQPVKDFLAQARKQGHTASNLGVHIKLPKAPTRPAARLAREAAPGVLLTADGQRKLGEELEALKGQRPRLVDAIRLARADGDLKENAPYHAAREQQGQVEARIRELEATLATAEVLGAPRADSVKADLGATVLVVEEASGREFRYILVAPSEARPAEGRLSVASPLGKSLVERSQGEVVEVAAPAGVTRYRLARVER